MRMVKTLLLALVVWALAVCALALPLRADPVSGFLYGAITAFSGAAVGAGIAVSGAFAAGYAVTGGVMAVAGTFLGRMVLAVGLSALAARLAARSVKPTAAMANYAQAVSYMQRGYGVVRVGGVFGFSGFRDKKRHYTILIAAHSTVGPLEHYLSDRVVDVLGGPITGLTAAAYKRA